MEEFSSVLMQILLIISLNSFQFLKKKVYGTINSREMLWLKKLVNYEPLGGCFTSVSIVLHPTSHVALLRR